MYPLMKGGALALVAVAVSAYAGVDDRSAPQSASSPASEIRLAAAAADLSGSWSGTLTDPGGGKHPVRLEIKSAGETFSGTLTGGPPDGSAQPIANGKVRGDDVSFETNVRGPQGEAVVLRFEGKVSGNRIQGVHGIIGMGIDLPWELTKQ